jgi:hypothetical protein
MKSVILACLISVVAISANAKGHGGGHRISHRDHSGAHHVGTGSNPNSHRVNGYTRKDGTYVAPHHSTNPNHTQRDNYGTVGNHNPHNGQYGNRYADR